MNRIPKFQNVGGIEDVGAIVAEDTVVRVHVEREYSRSSRCSVAAVVVSNTEDLTERVVRYERNPSSLFLQCRLQRVIVRITPVRYEVDVTVALQRAVVIGREARLGDWYHLPSKRIRSEESAQWDIIWVGEVADDDAIPALVSNVRDFEQHASAELLVYREVVR